MSLSSLLSFQVSSEINDDGIKFGSLSLGGKKRIITWTNVEKEKEIIHLNLGC
jgi:hypothetical protein